ncbi:MAG: HlyD family efflux transporter periplasmic adaptor subunit, partial [Oscillospiraceae bacterium]
KKTEYDGMLKAYDAELEAYKTVRKTYEDAGTSKVLEDLNKKLTECTIKSESNGVITAINAVVGSAMGQSANAGTGPLAVIQDTDNLVISTSFKEYDIPNIKIGQKVSIKSDATGDKAISGTVSQISLTANASQNGGNDVSFPAEIQVETPDSGLLVGMNAKANVILSQKDNIFVVPADAIGTNEKGEQVVYVKNGEIFEPVVVTTGEKNDFYTEIISTKLSVGTIVRSNADEAAAGMMSGGGMAAGGDTSGMSVAVVAG